MYPDPAPHSPPNDRELSHTGGIRKTHPKTFWALVFLGGGAFLFFLLGPAIMNARQAALRSSSKGLQKQIGLAFHNYADLQGGFPPHTSTDPAGTPLHGWQTHVLPFVDQDPLHSRIDFAKAWDHPDNAAVFTTPIYTYAAVGRSQEFSPRGFALTGFAANSQLLRVNDTVKLDDITDGVSNTITIGEIMEARPPWGQPGNVRDPGLGQKKGATTFGGPFEGGTQFGFADGSVRFISEDIDPDVLKALATPAAGDDTKGYPYD